MNSLVVGLLLVLCFSFSNELRAKDVSGCASLDCDCGAIVHSSWRLQCERGEATIKRFCLAEEGKLNKYCSLHGPAGFPVAIKSSFTPVEVFDLNTAGIRAKEKAIGRLLWSIRSDLELTRERIDQRHFGEAIQILTVVDKNIKSAFLSQRRLAYTWQQQGNIANARSAWRDFSASTAKSITNFRFLADSLWGKMQANVRSSDQKAYRVLSSRLLRMTGHLSEQAATGYAQSQQYKRAAEQWQASADISRILLERESLTTNKQDRLTYYRYQAAARLNRASYHWIQDDNNILTAEAHNQAQQMMGEKPVVLMLETVNEDQELHLMPINDEAAKVFASGHHAGVIAIKASQDRPQGAIPRIKK